jgi:hypothetical protein
MEGFQSPNFGPRYGQLGRYWSCQDCGRHNITDRVQHDMEVHSGSPSLIGHWASMAGDLERLLLSIVGQLAPPSYQSADTDRIFAAARQHRWTTIYPTGSRHWRFERAGGRHSRVDVKFNDRGELIDARANEGAGFWVLNLDGDHPGGEPEDVIAILSEPLLNESDQPEVSP